MIIRLHPTGPWRIGPDSGDRDRVDRLYHSDSLSSAVASAMARLGHLEDWLDATARAVEPAVRLGSCFPFQGDTLLVVPPRSVWPPPASSKVRWKGARFVPISVVEDLINGRTVSDEGWIVDGASECLTPHGSSGPFRVAVRSSAAVDRLGAAIATHSTACIEFAPSAGLWTVVSFANDEAREEWSGRLQGAVRLLGDSGFGGERSRGWGRAEVSFSDEPFFSTAGRPSTGAVASTVTSTGAVAMSDAPSSTPARAESVESAWWMLSLFHPASADSVNWQRGNYSLITRGGRIESDAGWGHAKQSTRMIAEGSVIVAAAPPLGSAVNVAPDSFPHPVYRSGFALAVPISISTAGRQPALAERPLTPGPAERQLT